MAKFGFTSCNTFKNNFNDLTDKFDKNWTAKTWTGLSSLSGSRTWTDGTDIYYSNANMQYVLDKSTSTWSAKTWNGLTNFEGNRILTDGNNIYYLNNDNQYVLKRKNTMF